MQLNDYQKSKVRFHLGYNAGAQVPAGDRSRLEEAMALVPDSYFYDQLVYQIRRCEVAWTQSQFYTDTGTPKGFSRLEEIAGDVQRTIRTTDPLKADADTYELYLRECDRQRSGAEFVMAVPGPADTAVGTRMMLYENYR